MMISDFKPGRSKGQNYHIFYQGTYDRCNDGWVNPTHYKPEETNDLLSKLAVPLYGFLWKQPDWEIFGDDSKTSPTSFSKKEILTDKYPENEMVMSHHLDFNLDLFLGSLKAFIPTATLLIPVVLAFKVS